MKSIEHILTTHPTLHFVLVGDSGQKDPEVYREVVQRYPDRVAAVYIRDVSAEDRDAEIDGIAADLARLQVELVRVGDTVAAAEHAVSRGFIDPAALSEIRGERAEDLASSGPFDWQPIGSR